MKHFFVCISFCFFFFNTNAQNYQPFKKGIRYQYLNETKDTVYSFHFVSAIKSGEDSIFTFNPVVKLIPPIQNQAGVVDSNNVFGYKMIKKNNDEYIFLSYKKDSFLLKTNVPLGTTWKFSRTLNITATFLSIDVVNILGITDTVKVIQLSDGNYIKLSPNYGIWKSVNLQYYFTKKKFNPLTLDAIPELGIGLFLSNPFLYYDFQPGDVFGYLDSAKGEIGNPFFIKSRQIILSRNDFGKDSILYRILRKVVKRYRGNDFSLPGNEITEDTIQLMIYAQFNPKSNKYEDKMNWKGLYDLTNEYTPGPPEDRPSGMTSIFKGGFDRFSLAYTILNGFEHSFFHTSAIGLGTLHRGSWDFGSNGAEVHNERLECYINKSETYGDCSLIDKVLATESVSESNLNNLKIHHNGEELMVSLDNPNGLHYDVSLYNTLGFCNYKLPSQNIFPLHINTTKLAPGIYILEVTGKNSYKKTFSKF